MNFLSYIPFIKKNPLIRLTSIFRKLIKKSNFKVGKMILPDGREIPMIYNPKATLIADDIKGVDPMGGT